MINSSISKRYGVTNSSTAGFAWLTDDLESAKRCARTICAIVIDTRDGSIVFRSL